MKNKNKIWLISAAALILTGLIIFGGVMTMLKWDFTKLSTVKYETNEYQINEDFNDISVTTKTANVVFLPTDKESPYVVCREQRSLKHKTGVNNGTLTVEIADTRKWYEYIGINFATPQITVYLPSGSYGALTLKTTTGDVQLPSGFTFDRIEVSGNTGNVSCLSSTVGEAKIMLSTGKIQFEGASFGSLDLTASTGGIDMSAVTCAGDLTVSVSTGKINLTNVSCKNLISSGDTGDLNLKNVTASGKFDIKRDTGDVKFDGCDAGEIFVTTDTGDINGTLLSEKVFFPVSKTGKTDTPKTVSGGRCEITTDTGDIIISIVKSDD